MTDTPGRLLLLADDVNRRDWRTFRVDRIEAARRTGHRFTPRADAPDALALVGDAITNAPYRHHAVVAFPAPPEEVRAKVPPTVGVVEPDGEGSLLAVGADDLAALAGHLVALDLPFEVLEPEVLRQHLRAMARRVAAAHR